jgi:hypothetical protein
MDHYTPFAARWFGGTVITILDQSTNIASPQLINVQNFNLSVSTGLQPIFIKG